MKICKACNNENPGDARKCEFCGTGFDTSLFQDETTFSDHEIQPGSYKGDLIAEHSHLRPWFPACPASRSAVTSQAVELRAQ